jgi:hypothetical protein
LPALAASSDQPDQVSCVATRCDNFITDNTSMTHTMTDLHSGAHRRTMALNAHRLVIAALLATAGGVQGTRTS